jgi:hypothetical protein
MSGLTRTGVDYLPKPIHRALARLLNFVESNTKIPVKRAESILNDVILHARVSRELLRRYVTRECTYYKKRPEEAVSVVIVVATTAIPVFLYYYCWLARLLP